MVKWCGTQPPGESTGGGIQDIAREGGCDIELATSPQPWDQVRMVFVAIDCLT